LILYLRIVMYVPKFYYNDGNDSDDNRGDANGGGDGNNNYDEMMNPCCLPVTL